MADISEAERIARELRAPYRAILQRVPAMIPAEGWYIAPEGMRAAQVAGFARKYPELIERLPSGQRMAYRLRPLGFDVRKIVEAPDA